MNDSDYVTINKKGAWLRIAVMTLIIGGIIAAMVLGTPKEADLGAIWDERTTIGNVKAKNHYVMTTDIMCPYCDYFSRALMSKQSEFEKYLAENDIVFEVRVTDFLNEYGEAGAKSEQAAEATLCATEENRFWDYYHKAMRSLDEDYHSRGIANAKGAPGITHMDADYWLKIGQEIGLGDSFRECYREHKMLDKVRENTKKTAQIMQKSNSGGMPYFRFGKFETSGFDKSWGFEEIKRYYLDAGLRTK